MSLLASLVPLNLQTEKTRFTFDHHYNPQFVYTRDFTPEVLTRFGLPQASIEKIAWCYLQNETEKPKPAIKSETYLTPLQIKSQVMHLTKKLTIPDIGVVFKGGRLARAAMKDGELWLSATSKITKKNLEKILAHEIQTHFLRAYNQKQQTFGQYKPSVYLRTEEGLAVFNGSFCERELNFKSICQKYLGVALAQSQSFSEVFAWRMSLPETNFEQAWRFTMRVKRGLNDTSQPGGLTKDLVYLEGFLEVLDWLSQTGNDYRQLYWGKIPNWAVADLKPLVKTEKLIYPTFMADLPALLAWVASCKAQLGWH